MKNQYVLLIVLAVIIIVVAGYFIFKTPQIETKNIPVQGSVGISNSEEAQISELISKSFFSDDILGEEISKNCDSSNTLITLLTNVIAEGSDSEDRIGAKVECNCGIDCGYSATYQIKKVNNEWIIESESEIGLT